MTPIQKKQFNQMLSALKTISKDYQSPDQLRKTSEKQFGLDYEEAIEMAYENIQMVAKINSKGVKQIK